VVPQAAVLAAFLAEAGLHLSRELLRPGTVMNFDTEGNATILDENLHSADQYVDAIIRKGMIQQEPSVEPPR
jgi:hypothetical protein